MGMLIIEIGYFCCWVWKQARAGWTGGGRFLGEGVDHERREMEKEDCFNHVERTLPS